jgi:hypothetical protein
MRTVKSEKKQTHSAKADCWGFIEERLQKIGRQENGDFPMTFQRRAQRHQGWN